MHRILFVSEAVTLAQVVRLATLARALDPSQYEIHFAAAHFADLIFSDTRFVRHPIFSLSPHTIDRRVAGGRRLYGVRTLARYVDDECALFRRVRPALVVGDLRLSLGISTARMQIPYANLINAYWSPAALRRGFPLPDHPIVRLLGVKMAEQYFPKALPWVFAHFARPVNILRRRHGLPSLGSLPEVLTSGDYTLFPDVPALVPTHPLPPTQHYLGPVLWSPPLPLPSWWDCLDSNRPLLYVTLGSSGRADQLPLVVETAATLGFEVVAATAGRVDSRALSRTVSAHAGHVHVCDFLPGARAARRAVAVVSNGGSTTGYQALSEGKPVLGIASNLDQYLAMTAIADAGAGLLLRSGNLEAPQLREALLRLRDESAFTAQAARLAGEFSRWSSPDRFVSLVKEAIR